MHSSAPSTTQPFDAAIATRRVGRPARVKVEDILDAAIAIGLEKVTLRRVAQKLGVGVATLYRHVSGRDELVRMASFRLALSRQDGERAPTPGRHWAEITSAYAESLVEVFTAQPQLIGELAAGRLPPETELIFLEPFLAELSGAGVEVAEGMRLHNAVAMLAVGAAAGAAGANASGGGARLVASMQKALTSEGEDRYPHVARGLDCYRAGERAHWRSALLPMLQGFAHMRGEQLPDGLGARLAHHLETAGQTAWQETTT